MQNKMDRLRFREHLDRQLRMEQIKSGKDFIPTQAFNHKTGDQSWKRSRPKPKKVKIKMRSDRAPRMPYLSPTSFEELQIDSSR